MFAHGGGLGEQDEHFNRKTNTYECHKELCLSNHQQANEAYKQAKPGTSSKVYNRKDWPH